jgi:hypothetical protein
MSHRALARSLTQAVTNANLAAAHSTITIAARLPILGGYFLSPTPSALAEWNRAYAEKVAAMVEGVAAAAAEMQALMLKSAFRAPTAAGFADDCLRVAHKAGHPGRRRVKANAKRLTRTKPKKQG